MHFFKSNSIYLISVVVFFLSNRSDAENEFVLKCKSDIRADYNGEYSNVVNHAGFALINMTFQHLGYIYSHLYFEYMRDNIVAVEETQTPNEFCEKTYSGDKATACKTRMEFYKIPMTDKEAALKHVFFYHGMTFDEENECIDSYIKHLFYKFDIKSGFLTSNQFCEEELPKHINSCGDVLSTTFKDLKLAKDCSRKILLRSKTDHESYRESTMVKIYWYYFGPYIYPTKNLKRPTVFCLEDYPNEVDKCKSDLKANGFLESDTHLLALRRAMYDPILDESVRTDIVQKYIEHLSGNFILMYNTLDQEEFCAGVLKNEVALLTYRVTS